MTVYNRVITFGTFDLLHEGHLSILERARALGKHLIVGVSSDRLNSLKGKKSVFPEHQRLSYVRALRCVDEAFLEESLELKDEYIKAYDVDLLVMGDDWAGKFDWVSCETKYVPRTEGISSTVIKERIEQNYNPFTVLFYDCYIQKHFDCALALIPGLAKQRVTCLIPREEHVRPDYQCDCLVFFNKPRHDPHAAYGDKPLVLIDHGASNLKWFLSGLDRFHTFDRIITAGPDHVRSVESFFAKSDKVVSAGFVKSSELFAPSTMTRVEFCRAYNLNPDQKIVVFLPTWHKSDHPDIRLTLELLKTLRNHIVCFHPETEFFGLEGVNIAKNEAGVTTELLKHADVVISDFSSTLFEAAALDKEAIQLLLREYPDNPSTLYDFPLTAGMADLFCGGLPTRPAGLLESLDFLSAGQVDLGPLRARILEGTIISTDASDIVAAEVAKTCALASTKFHLDRRGQAAHRSNNFRRNLALSTNRIIAHAAGQWKGLSYTNSREALESSTDVVKFVELDAVLGNDGVLIAHDACESHYGIATRFSQISQSEFKSLLYRQTGHTLDLQTAMEIAKQKAAVLIFDVKSIGAEYERVVTEIAEAANMFDCADHVAVQAFCQDDYEFCCKMSLRMILPAVWKYHYRDPLGTEAFNFCHDCFKTNRDAMIGLSLPFSNRLMRKNILEDERLVPFFRFWKRIYVHAAPFDRYSDLLARNLGLFAQAISPHIEFSQLSADFSWTEYAFINNDQLDLASMTMVDSIKHFVNIGRSRGLRTKYKLHNGFDPEAYLRERRDLRALGYSGPNSINGLLTREDGQEVATA